MQLQTYMVTQISCNKLVETCTVFDKKHSFLLANCCMIDPSFLGSVEYMCNNVLHAAVQVAPVRNTDRLCLHKHSWFVMSISSIKQVHRVLGISMC